MSESRENFEQILRNAAAEVLGVSPDSISTEARLREDLGMDSIDKFDVLALLEKELKRDLEGQMFESVETVAEFVKRMEEIVSSQGSDAV